MFPGSLLAAGARTGLVLQVKYLVPALWLGIGVGALVVGGRDLLHRPALWAGAAVAVVAVLPGRAWQAANGWPHLRALTAVGAERHPRLVPNPLLSGEVGWPGLANAVLRTPAIRVCTGPREPWSRSWGLWSHRTAQADQ